jgi:Tol biopolymer transport system component
MDRYERRLPDQLRELAGERTPDYLDDLLARTAGTRQRPAWTLPERWLPATLPLHRPMPALSVRLTAIGVAMLLALIGALTVVPFLASPRPMPAVVALPGNGPIVASVAGDLVLIDPATRRRSATAPQPGPEVDPRFSPDGKRLAWWEDQGDGWVLHIGPASLATEPGDLVHAFPFPDSETFTWSPDSTRIAVWTGSPFGFDGVAVVTDQRHPSQSAPVVEQLGIGFSVGYPAWRPDGEALLVRGEGAGVGIGLFVVELGGGIDPIRIASAAEDAIDDGRSDLLDAQWSPDGSHIAYHSLHAIGDAAPDRNGWRVHVMRADGTDDRMLQFDPMSDDEFRPTWSADSRRLLYPRRDAGVITLVLAPADGSSPGTVTEAMTGDPAGDWSVSWSPDETLIVGADHDRGLTVLIDMATGRATPTDWGITGGADWQPLP